MAPRNVGSGYRKTPLFRNSTVRLVLGEEKLRVKAEMACWLDSGRLAFRAKCVEAVQLIRLDGCGLTKNPNGSPRCFGLCDHSCNPAIEAMVKVSGRRDRHLGRLDLFQTHPQSKSVKMYMEAPLRVFCSKHCHKRCALIGHAATLQSCGNRIRKRRRWDHTSRIVINPELSALRIGPSSLPTVAAITRRSDEHVS